MTDHASFKPVHIVVDGKPKPYVERSIPAKRKKVGKAGQAVGSLTIRSVKPKSNASYQREIQWAARAAMRGQPLYAGPVRLKVMAFVPIPKKASAEERQAIMAGDLLPIEKPDVTNVQKLAEDALTEIILKDDDQVVRLSDDSGRYYSNRPRIEITVSPLGHCTIQAQEFDNEQKPTRRVRA